MRVARDRDGLTPLERDVLVALADRAPSWGYEVAVRLGRRDRADSGGIYKALARLERRRLLASWQERTDTVPARVRRMYRATAIGQVVARHRSESGRSAGPPSAAPTRRAVIRG